MMGFNLVLKKMIAVCHSKSYLVHKRVEEALEQSAWKDPQNVFLTAEQLNVKAKLLQDLDECGYDSSFTSFNYLVGVFKIGARRFRM